MSLVKRSFSKYPTIALAAKSTAQKRLPHLCSAFGLTAEDEPFIRYSEVSFIRITWISLTRLFPVSPE